MKKIISILLVISIMLSFTACVSQQSVQESEPDQSEVTQSSKEVSEEAEPEVDNPYLYDGCATLGEMIPLNSDTVKLNGRTYESDGTRYFSWTDSGFTINFSGQTVVADIELKANDPENLPYIEVIVDDGVPVKIQITESGKYYLTKDIEDSEHNLKVYKLTEASNSRLGFVSLQLNEGGSLLEKPEPLPIKIEFIGDSITCGHSILRKSANKDIYTSATQDGMQTYAALTAENFNADFNIVAISGYAINYRAGTDRESTCMPEIYSYVDPANGNTDEWDFSSFIPDVVVVALGTNDDVSTEEKQAEFIKYYKEFLLKLRGYYPNATIVCTLGMMKTSPYTYITQAINELDDGNIYAMLELASNPYGHPMVAEHQRTAQQLTKFIADIKGWRQ